MSADERVAEILGEWYARGECEPPEDVVRAHPELAEALQAGFAARELLGCARLPSPDPVTQGARVIGDFRLGRELGRGGMGVVYEAEQISMGRRVALKLLDPAITFSARAVERFRREAHAAGRLHHTNIVPVFAMGEQDGVWYYAMEWVRGATLAEVITALRGREPPAATGPTGVSDARAGAPGAPGPSDSSGLTTSAGGHGYFARVATICAGVADALAFAHAAGVTHRDIKPENLVFDAVGTLKIMDFGLAHVEGEASRTVAGDLLGTPAYMSPEQARGGGAAVDGRSDVYSLGATLYELLTLRPPFQGGDPHETCLRVLTQAPVQPRRLRPAIPRDLETIILKAMERAPERRYASAQALADDLRAFAEHRPIAARRVGPVGRAWRGMHRHPALSLLGLVVAMLVVAVGLLAIQAAEESALRRSLHAGHAGAGERAASSPWLSRTQIPLGSYGLGAAFLEGRLYAISGYFTPRVAVYDPAHDSWSQAAELPRPLQFFGTAVLDGRIYVVGGDLGGSGASAELLVLDPGAAAWVKRAPMPGGSRWDVGVAVLDRELWVLGGIDGGTGAYLTRVEIYDPATDRWRTGPPLPAPRGLSGSVGVIDGRIYAAGGTRDHAWVTTLEMYDPAIRRWTSRSPLPRAADAKAAVVEGRLVMAGGGAKEDAARVLSYDPYADAWREEPSMRWPRRAHAVAYDPVGLTLYALAGYIESTSATCETYSWPPVDGGRSNR